ncbi:hypothetical protein BC332_28528 [Capsicum chinense]|nr:hypothetical protein BC332_28528 [Capsicum chinense]
MRDNNEAVYNEDKNEAHDKEDGIRTMLEEVVERSFVNYSEETGNDVCSNMSEKEAITFDILLKEDEQTFDASDGESFKMHVAVLWTINDFSAYGNLSRWSTKGYMACPTCNKDASSKRIIQLFNKEKLKSIIKVYPLAMGLNVYGTKRTGCIANGVRCQKAEGLTASDAQIRDADTVMDVVDPCSKFHRNEQTLDANAISGKNLNILSQIEGIDLDLYKETVLPRVLEQVINCKDKISQGYLIDCNKVFPDEYHLGISALMMGSLYENWENLFPNALNIVQQFGERRIALVSGGRSTLNRNAPLFIPYYARKVEDFSPECWNLVTTTTWFCDYWASQHQDEEFGEDDFEFARNDVANLVPENFDLDIDENILNMESQFEESLQSSSSLPKGSKALIRTLSMPKPKSSIEPLKYYEKPTKIVSPTNNLRRIQRPR